MFKYDVGVALASIFLAGMFVAYFISLFNVFTKPLELGIAEVLLQAWQKAFIGMTVFGFPSIGMAVASYFLAKRYANKVVSMILIAQGVLVILGMQYVLSISNVFITEYKQLNLEIVPQWFMLGGIVPLGFGIRLYMLKPQKRSRFFTQ